MNSISSSSSAPTRELYKQKAAYLQKLAQFFFLSTLDEEMAALFSRRAAGEFLRKGRDASEPLSDRTFVQVCYFSLKKLWSEGLSDQAFTVTYQKGWAFPEPVDLASWAAFRRQADLEEFTAVLFLRVLKIPENSVSQALGVTVGTLRFRLARGLRSLAQHLTTDVPL